MKRPETILIAFACFAAVLGYFSVEGASFLRTVAFMLLALLYFGFGFLVLNGIAFRSMFKKSAYQDLNWWKILWAFFIGQCFSTQLIGLLFLFNQWEGVAVLFFNGYFLSAIIFFVSGSLYIIRRSKFNLGILIRATAFIVIYSLVFLLI